MGILLDLLRAAKGEASTESQLGRWRKRVSQALDGGAAAPDYGFAKKGPAAAVVALNDTLPLELTGQVRGVSYVEASYSWILTPGKTYLLQADGWFASFDDAVGGLIDVAWVDDNNARLATPLVDSPTARFRPATSTVADTAGAGTLSMIYTVPTSDPALRVAKLRILNATGTAQMPSGSWTSTVLEIPG